MNVSLWLSSDCFSFPCHKMSCLSLRFVCSFFSSSSGKLRMLLWTLSAVPHSHDVHSFSFRRIGSAVRVHSFQAPWRDTKALILGISKYYGDFHPSLLNCSHTGAAASLSSLRTPIAVHSFAVKETLASKIQVFWAFYLIFVLLLSTSTRQKCIVMLGECIWHSNFKIKPNIQ